MLSDEKSEASENERVNVNRKWTSLETMGRCMFLCSVAFFIAGVTVTVFGYTGVEKSHQTTLKILGPACLTMTVVMWLLGCVLSRMWNLEWKRRQQAFELRERVHLHAYAMDILNNPSLQVQNLDPVIKRQLLRKLRMQTPVEYSNSDVESGRFKRKDSITGHSCKRRYSQLTFDRLSQPDEKDRTPLTIYECPKGKEFELPGIQISRFETFDLEDRRSSIASGSRHYIVIHSDLGSDLSRLSCPSDYSLGGSRRSSRSRSSRASSNVSFISSRIWDFSPRESEWDTDVSLGSSYCSQISIHRADWGGAICEHICDDHVVPYQRKLSVLTFNAGAGAPRRHSSPATARRHSTPMFNGRKSEDERKQNTDSSSKYRTTSEEDAETSNWNEATDTDCTGSGPAICRLPARRSTLKRNNTDDSEVERRVATLLREIELSASESVDESKIYSVSSECECSAPISRPRVEVRECETQTAGTQDEASGTSQESRVGALLRKTHIPAFLSGLSRRSQRQPRRSYNYQTVPANDQLGRTPPPAYEDIMKDG